MRKRTRYKRYPLEALSMLRNDRAWSNGSRSSMEPDLLGVDSESRRIPLEISAARDPRYEPVEYVTVMSLIDGQSSVCFCLANGTSVFSASRRFFLR